MEQSGVKNLSKIGFVPKILRFAQNDGFRLISLSSQFVSL